MTSSDPGGTSDLCRRIVAHPVVNVYRGPSRDAGLVSQTLLGLDVREIDASGPSGWRRVQTDDTYRGWVEGHFLADFADGREAFVVTASFADVRERPCHGSTLLVRLSLESRLRSATVDCAGSRDGSDDWAAVNIAGAVRVGFVPVASLRRADAPLPLNHAGVAALRCALNLVGTPYVWGGTSAFGVDCSGLTQLAYRSAGVTLRRDADQQRDDPRFVDVAFADMAPGDLLFFGSSGRITHVALWVGGDTFLHASGGTGVVLTEWGDDRYSPTFVDARRLDPARAHEPVSRWESDDR